MKYAEVKSQMEATFGRLDDVYELAKRWLRITPYLYIAIDSRDLTIRYVFGDWEGRLGWSPAELRGRVFTELVHEEDRPITEALARGGDNSLLDKWKENEGTIFLNRYQCKDGGYVWMKWQGQGVEPVNDLILGVAEPGGRCCENGGRRPE